MTFSSERRAQAAFARNSVVRGTMLRSSDLKGAPADLRRRRWLLTGQIVCTLALVGWILRQIDFQPLVEHFSRIRWAAIVLLIAVGLLDRFLTTWKWHILLTVKGIRLSLSEAFRIQMIATFFGSFLPTALGMDAVRIYLAAKRTGLTVETVSASTVDRLLTVIGTFLFAGAALAMAPVRYPNDSPYWFVGLSMLLLTAGLLVLGHARWLHRLRSPAARVLGSRLMDLSTKLYCSMREFSSQRGAVAASCAVMLASFLVRIVFVQIAATALGVDVAFRALMLLLPLTWVALMLPISIGGLGLQESAYLLALTPAGITPAAAVAISLLEQVLMRTVSLLGALFWLMRRRNVEAIPAVSSVR